MNGYMGSLIPNNAETGRQGFQQWECYMLLKYGNKGNFGLGGNTEYLCELPLYPEAVQESINANWEEQSVIGRSAPLSAYSNTSLKSVSFSMDLHRDFLTGSYSLTDENLREIASETRDKRVSYDTVRRNQAAGRQYDYVNGLFGGRTWYININKMLQMACYPQYTNAGAIPPTTYFVFGQMILKGYIESYSTQWKKPIINTFYGWNSVSITMKCYPDTVISASDIISGNTSTQNTYNTRFPSKVGSSNVMARDFGRGNYRGSSSIGNLTDILIT